MSFRVGSFDRSRLGRTLRQFCPVEAAESLLDVSPSDLFARGKKLVLLDVDNTLLGWGTNELPQTTHAWVSQAQEVGLHLCILSNTRHPERLKRLAAQLKIEFLNGKFKPSPEMYLQALHKFGVSAQETLMIGDQLFTDILGANRAGMDSIWVRPMTNRDFVGTKVSRLGERILRPRLYRAMLTNDVSSLDHETVAEEPIEDLSVGGSAAVDLLAHPIVRQFVKFVIVGASSTLIDMGIFAILMYVIPYGTELLSRHVGEQLIHVAPRLFSGLATRPDGGFEPSLAASPLFRVIGSAVAIYNSFIWNRKWTFRIEGHEHKSVQLRKFFIIAIIGLILNAVITSVFANVIPGHWKKSSAVGAAIATVVVAFWNFFGQKLWTFKKHS